MRRWRVASLLVLLALAGCGPERVDRWTPPAASTPPSPAAGSAAPTTEAVPAPSPSAAPSPVSSPSAIPLGVLRIPFANREMELAIVGVPGVLGGWRAATGAELGAVAWGEADITIGGLTEREHVLGWGGTVCDIEATLDVAPRRLVVRPAPREGCDAMWLGRGVVLTFAEPVDPASIAVMLDPVPMRPEDEATPPPLNPAERWIEAALARIGLVARVAEGSPRDRASMYVDLGADRPLAIATVPAQAAPSDWQVVAVRQLAGIELRTVRNDGGFESEWIVCGPQLVEVFGTAPDGYPTMDAFIERLVPALDCRS